MAQFKYLGRPLYQTDNDWTEVRQNIKQAHKVWGRLVKILQREKAYIKVLDIFYRAVVQLVLLFGSESWFLSEETEKMVEGAHTGFLCQIMGKRARRNTGGMWVTISTGGLR